MKTRILAAVVLLPLLFGGQIQGRFTLWQALGLPEAQQTAHNAVLAAAGGATAQTPALYAAEQPFWPRQPQAVTGLEGVGALRLEALGRVLFWSWLGAAALLLVWFLSVALRQAAQVRRFSPADPALEQRVRALVQTWLPGENWVNQPDCFRVVIGPAHTAPYVCRAGGPVLVLPAGQQVDDRVLLHELCHLAWGDLGKNSLILLFRCFYWCNPLLWWVLGRVCDDLEAACDERVLALLTPAQQIDYGRVLLSMTVPSFRRRPATSCIASGQRQIRQRIARTARYCEITSFSRGAGIGAALVLFALTCLMPAPLISYPPQWQPAPVFHQASLARLKTRRASGPLQALFLYGLGEAADCGAYRYVVADDALRGQLEKQFAANAAQGRANPWHYDSQLLELAAQELIPYHAGELARQPGLSPEQAAAAYSQAAQTLLDTPEWYLGQEELWPIAVGFSLCDVVRQGQVWTAAVSYTVQRQDPLNTSETINRFYTDQVELTRERGRWVVRRTHRRLCENLWPYAHHPDPSLLQRLAGTHKPLPLPQGQGIPALSGSVEVEPSTGCPTGLPREPFFAGSSQATPGWGPEIYGQPSAPVPKEVTDHA